MCSWLCRRWRRGSWLIIIIWSSLSSIDYSIFLRFPLGAGLMRGVYVTVRVRISRTWRTFPPADFGALRSIYLALL